MHTNTRPIKFTAERGSAESPMKIFKVKAMFVTGSDKACTEQKWSRGGVRRVNKRHSETHLVTFHV